MKKIITPITNGIFIILASLAILFHAYDIYFSETPKEIADNWIMMEQFFFHIPMVLAFTLIFRKKITYLNIALSIIIAFLLNQFDIIFGLLHNFLVDYNIYPDFFYHGTTNVNVQYTLILLYLVSFSILFISLLKKRSFDRIFIFIILMTLLGTTTLFHYVIVDNALKNVLLDARQHKIEKMRLLIPQIKENSEICKEYQTVCLFLKEDETLSEYDPDLISSDLLEAIKRIKQETVSKPTYFEQKLKISALNENLKGDQYIFFRNKESEIFILIDIQKYQKYAQEYKKYFAILMISAHTWWLGGGLFLLFWHKNRVKKKQKTKIVI